MDDTTRAQLRGELDSLDVASVYTVLSSITLPRVMMKDNIRAKLLHTAYTRMREEKPALPQISKPCFLYIYLCMRSRGSPSVSMTMYSYFSDERIDVSKVSYRDYTQALAVAPSVSTAGHTLRVVHEYYFCTVIYFRYPVSLRHLLDKVATRSSDDSVVLSENNVLYVKVRPTVMDRRPPAAELYRGVEKNTLLARVGTATIRSDSSHLTLESSDPLQHSTMLSMLRNVLPVSRVVEVSERHIFMFPYREVNYPQVLDWLRRSKVIHSSIEGSQHTVVDNFMGGHKCEFTNVVLDSSKCYTVDESEVYRVKGDKVLHVIVHGSGDTSHIRDKVLSMYDELDHTIEDRYIDPLETDASNISKLRATNSTVFDSHYCRRAPPIVQPLIIKESEVEDTLAKGKVILKYQGVLYTTKDKEVSQGQDYIGMINKFGDYDPRKAYVPIIRTYKTHHLESSNFKELKAYLLRHSPNPNAGVISKDDILLPKHLEHLYRRRLVNPNPTVTSIHSKKTTLSNTNKVDTLEVPDSVKVLIGSSSARRRVESHQGTGLLGICRVCPEDMLMYTLYNREMYPDLQSLSVADIERHISTCEVDHRLYGKVIEDIIGVSLIVFSMDGIVPYRCSKCEAEEYVLLYMSASGMYDRIVVNIHHNIRSSLPGLRDIANSAKVHEANEGNSVVGRDVDYTFVYLRLLGYLFSSATELGIRVKHVMIPESEVRQIVEAVYSRPACYEGYASLSKSDFDTAYVVARKKQYATHLSKDLLVEMLQPMVHSIGANRITVYSVVDPSKYRLWSFLLEDCLYFSSLCYSLEEGEELRVLDR